MLGKGSYYASLKVHRVDVDVIDVVLMAVIVVIVVVVLYLFRLLYGEGRRENGEWKNELSMDSWSVRGVVDTLQ